MTDKKVVSQEKKKKPCVTQLSSGETGIQIQFDLSGHMLHSTDSCSLFKRVEKKGNCHLACLYWACSRGGLTYYLTSFYPHAKR